MKHIFIWYNSLKTLRFRSEHEPMIFGKCNESVWIVPNLVNPYDV